MAFIIDKCAFMKNSMHVARMISYLERQSDLFSDSGELNFEQAYQSYVDASPPRVWHHIISLSDEDAQRQNVDREYMKQLCKRCFAGIILTSDKNSRLFSFR